MSKEVSIEPTLKGRIYRVTYQDDPIHSYTRYETNVIHIPELKAEINHTFIRKANDSYTKPMNGVKPIFVREIEINANDALRIETILKVKQIEKEIIKRYVPDIQISESVEEKKC